MGGTGGGGGVGGGMLLYVKNAQKSNWIEWNKRERIIYYIGPTRGNNRSYNKM